MESNINVSQIRIGEATYISKNELDDLIKLSEAVLEEDTLISGFVRILKYNNQYVFQEQTPKNEIIIRKFADLIFSSSCFGILIVIFFTAIIYYTPNRYYMKKYIIYQYYQTFNF